MRDYMEMWLTTYVDPVRAASTAKGYRQALRHLGDDVQDTELGQVMPLALQRDINILAARHSRQAQVLYAVLHAALGRAGRLGMVAPGLMAAVDKPAHRKRRMRWLTARQLAQYMTAAADDAYYVRLALMAICGLRRGEALAVVPGDVDTARAVLMVRRQVVAGQIKALKTESSCRDVPLGDGMMRLLMSRADYGYCSATTLYKHHQRVLTKARLPGVTIHELRHTCATTLLSAGAGMATIQHYLGHARYGTTADIYAHTSRDALTRAARMIDGLMEQQLGMAI